MNSPLRTAFQLSLPVAFGYIPMAAAFGVLFSTLGQHWFYAVLMGGLVTAGASQFAVVPLLSHGNPLIDIALSTFFINARHIFFGISFKEKYNVPFWKKFYMIFGLTDEMFSLVSSMDKDTPKNVFFFLTLFNHFYWILGCFLGAYLGSQFKFPTKGLEFSLTALFLVLTVDQFLAKRIWQPILLASAAALATLLLFGSSHFLVISIALTCLLILISQRLFP